MPPAPSSSDQASSLYPGRATDPVNGDVRTHRPLGCGRCAPRVPRLSPSAPAAPRLRGRGAAPAETHRREEEADPAGPCGRRRPSRRRRRAGRRALRPRVSRTQANVLWTHKTRRQRAGSPSTPQEAVRSRWSPRETSTGRTPRSAGGRDLRRRHRRQPRQAASVVVDPRRSRRSGASPLAQTATAQRFVCAYPDGARDAEALLVDPRSGARRSSRRARRHRGDVDGGRGLRDGPTTHDSAGTSTGDRRAATAGDVPLTAVPSRCDVRRAFVVEDREGFGLLNAPAQVPLARPLAAERRPGRGCSALAVTSRRSRRCRGGEPRVRRYVPAR